jgi:hypothetical protein
MSKKWKKLPGITQDKLHIGCLNCSTSALEAPMHMGIAVGFGGAYVLKDGECVYDGQWDYQSGNEPKTVRQIERMASRDPDHDWRIVKDGPMHGETFQRQGKGKWVCVESNAGFA